MVKLLRGRYNEWMNIDDERFIVSYGIDEWFLNFSDIGN